jgi:hypothetical protein
VSGYFDTLKSADWKGLLSADHLDALRGGGIFLLLATIALVIALLWYFYSVGTWHRGRVKQTIFLALLGAAFGWVGSVMGYREATASAGTAAPGTPEAANSAQGLAYAAFVPTAAALAVILLCILGLLVVHPKKRAEMAGA